MKYRFDQFYESTWKNIDDIDAHDENSQDLIGATSAALLLMRNLHYESDTRYNTMTGFGSLEVTRA